MELSPEGVRNALHWDFYILSNVCKRISKVNMNQKSTILVEQVKSKKVLFITTKNVDYIRNAQEIKLLKENAESVEILHSSKEKYIGRIIEIWIKLLFKSFREIDIVFIGFSPQLVLPFFKWKFKRKDIIIDFFISVYDTLIHDRQKFKDHGIAAKICHGIDSATLKLADYVIVDTNADARYFIGEFQSDKDKFETLYLEADRTIYYPREQHKREKLRDKFVVLYFGSILPLQGVDVVLDAIKLLQDNKDIFFQIIGPIPKKYNKPIQDNVEYIDWLSQEELAEHIADADLCLAGHFNGEIDKAKRTIPGKAYIYTAMKKKSILGDNLANRELYKENEENVSFVEMGDAKNLSEKIIMSNMKKFYS